MFTDACSLYYPLLCRIGGGSETIKGKLHGTGCMLSDSHALTAYHVIKEMINKYTWPVISKHDGLFKCEIIHSSEEYDIALIKASEKIDSCQLSKPNNYPNIFEDKPSIGMTVGYFSRLHKDDPDGNPASYTFFSSASLSFFMHNNSSVKWCLSGGFIEGGFSGSPVFCKDGSLVGILIESMQFRATGPHPIATVNTVPVMSPIGSLKEIIINGGVKLYHLAEQ